MLGRFCVFCGEKPKGKNREHIIPLWLLEMTGNAYLALGSHDLLDNAARRFM